ncbi:hypothetical protein AAHC03_022499 [Spirometra sp. Aus1]
MSSPDPTLFLVGIKQEETAVKEESAPTDCKISESFRPDRPHQCRRLIEQKESGPSEGDRENRDGESQSSSPSPTPLSLPTMAQDRGLPPASRPSTPTGELNATTCLFISAKNSSVAEGMEVDTSERCFLRREVEEPANLFEDDCNSCEYCSFVPTPLSSFEFCHSPLVSSSDLVTDLLIY